MARHMYFHREIEHLKSEVMALGALVEDRLRRACQLIQHHDPVLAQQIIHADWEVDDKEIHVEEECLKVLALHQPVARDLRLIITIIRMNAHLERVADIAVNLAKRMLSIGKRTEGPMVVDYGPMCEKVQQMLKTVLDAMVTENAEVARKLFIEDEEVDRLRDQAYHAITAEMQRTPEQAISLLNQYLISRHLERVGDWVTNMAEEVVYLVEGEIVRGDNEEEGR